MADRRRSPPGTRHSSSSTTRTSCGLAPPTGSSSAARCGGRPASVSTATRYPEAGGKVDASRLGAASSNPYSFDGHPASALTRPLDDNAARGAEPPLAQGFFLRLREEAFARGDKGTSSDPSVYAGATTYWDYDERRKAMTYWLFYLRQLAAARDPTNGRADRAEVTRRRRRPGGRAAAARARSRDRGRIPRGVPAGVPGSRARGRAHRADEGVRRRARAPAASSPPECRRCSETTTSFTRATGSALRSTSISADPEGAPPESVAFYRHSTNTFRKWDSVAKDAGTHPIAYSAIGSHASLPTPGFGHIDVGDPDGPRWRTWEDLASIVRAAVVRVRRSVGPAGSRSRLDRAARSRRALEARGATAARPRLAGLPGRFDRCAMMRRGPLRGSLRPR